MILLLDTHTFLWQCSDPEKISKTALRSMDSQKSSLWVSVASLWEIGILISLNRIKLDVSIRRLVEQSLRDAGVSVIPIEPNHIDELVSLPFFHRDPFDRLIIAQAKSMRATVVGKDDVFDRYGIERIWK